MRLPTSTRASTSSRATTADASASSAPLARPAIALERVERLPDGRYAYRTKYTRNGRTHRVMTGTELLARIAALVPPPRYPLVRYHGCFAPAHVWRRSTPPSCARPSSSPTESCTGADPACPTDAFWLSSTMCGTAGADPCDNDDFCTGSSASCPDDRDPDGTAGPDGTFCNGAETCQGGVCTTGSDACPDSDPTDCIVQRARSARNVDSSRRALRRASGPEPRFISRDATRRVVWSASHRPVTIGRMPPHPPIRDRLPVTILNRPARTCAWA